MLHDVKSVEHQSFSSRWKHYQAQTADIAAEYQC